MPNLLDGDRRACGLELGLGLLGSLLGDLLEQRLGSAVDEVLGLLEAQARDDLADDLDDADLLLAGTLEDDVELRLLLGGLGGRTAGGGAGSRDGDRRGGGDVEGLLERLDELGQLQQRQFLERVEQVFGGQLGHDWSFLTYLRVGWWWVIRRRRPTAPGSRVRPRQVPRLLAPEPPQLRVPRRPSSLAVPRTAGLPAPAAQ